MKLTCARRMLDLPLVIASPKGATSFPCPWPRGFNHAKPAAAAAAVAGYSELDGAVAVIVSEVIVRC